METKGQTKQLVVGWEIHGKIDTTRLVKRWKGEIATYIFPIWWKFQEKTFKWLKEEKVSTMKNEPQLIEYENSTNRIYKMSFD